MDLGLARRFLDPNGPPRTLVGTEMTCSLLGGEGLSYLYCRPVSNILQRSGGLYGLA